MEVIYEIGSMYETIVKLFGKYFNIQTVELSIILDEITNIPILRLPKSFSSTYEKMRALLVT
jgi:hypothetical protein